MNNSHLLLINNQWKLGNGPLFSSYNPMNDKVNWEGRAASQLDVDDAVESAQGAFKKWSLLSIDERFHYLSEFNEILRNSQQELSQVISQETGRPLWDSLTEVEFMIAKVGTSLEAHGRRCAGMIRDQPYARLTTRHRPYGVIAILGPCNLPGQVPNEHIIPALLAGNAVVFKPSSLTPLTAEKMMHYWLKANLPAGVLNLVQGNRETGQYLVRHSNIQGVFFSGTHQTGQSLAELFSLQSEKILALEMSGNNPLVVGDITNVQAAAYISLQSAFISSGQRCTCARRLIVPNNNQGDEIIHLLIEMTKSISIGPYTQIPEPFIGPLISKQHVQKVLAAQEFLISKGGKPLHFLKQLNKDQNFVNPGIIDVTEIIDKPDEEIFGPLLQVIRVNDFQEAIAEANQTKFGLSAGLISQKQEEYHYFYSHIRSGIINWNTPLTYRSGFTPFGGVKESGNHRPSGYYAADYCAYPVTSLESSDLKMPAFLSPGLNFLV